jgi:phosphoglucomutase
LGILKKYNDWLEDPGLEAELRNELFAISGHEKEITERFYRELDFGTAGLRGIIGAGTNRMNVHVIRRATQGAADYLTRNFPDCRERGVAIAYDSREKSDVFAMETALVLAGSGIRA